MISLCLRLVKCIVISINTYTLNEHFVVKNRHFLEGLITRQGDESQQRYSTGGRQHGPGH